MDYTSIGLIFEEAGGHSIRVFATFLATWVTINMADLEGEFLLKVSWLSFNIKNDLLKNL